jgi:oxygen-independent coproporphyrinogen III oxidase
VLSVSFGVYVHVPYCLQRCSYCDFAIYEFHEAISPEKYISLVLKEIQQRSLGVGPRPVTSLYFGGGTPSLLEPSLLSKVTNELESAGFNFNSATERTLEINPGTINEDSLQRWKDFGINRFSIGAQTFNDALLKKIGRKHSSDDTHKTLELLHGSGSSFTLDILFALPDQTHDMVLSDVETALQYDPQHVSVYCLTLPEQHPLNRGRPLDSEQAEMFESIEERLSRAGLTRYEVSNYSKPGYESRHNRIYWTDKEYWGVGLSAHSYLKREKWGVRFWNPSGLKAYENLILKSDSAYEPPYQFLPTTNVEILTLQQSMTDYCHTHLRTLIGGLDEVKVRAKYPDAAATEIMNRLSTLEKRELVARTVEGHWCLSRQGRLLADSVFEELTFLKNENFAEKPKGLGGALG